MNIVFLGAPGTGKGTIASRLAKKYNFTHIAPGDLFRKEVKKQTALGKKIKSIMEKGILVPDEVTNKLVKKNIKRNNIFDGYPRNLVQAKALDSCVKVNAVILFKMSEKQIIARLAGRRTCPNCQAIYHIKNIKPKIANICDKCGAKLIQREDDKPKTVKKRFQVYKKQTAPLISLYKKRRILKTIDASKSPEHVYNNIKKLLNLK